MIAGEDSATSLESTGLSRSTIFKLKDYKIVKLDEEEVVTKREAQTIKYLGKTYAKEGGAKNAKWVLKT